MYQKIICNGRTYKTEDGKDLGKIISRTENHILFNNGITAIRGVFIKDVFYRRCTQTANCHMPCSYRLTPCCPYNKKYSHNFEFYVKVSK